MAKTFTVKEADNVEISNDVLVSIIAVATSEVDGVIVNNGKPAASEGAVKKSMAKNISVTENDSSLDVTVNITVEYGKPIVPICNNVQKAVYEAVKNYIGIELSSVEVNVSNVYFPKVKK